MDQYLTPMPSTPAEDNTHKYQSRPVDSNQDDIHPRLVPLLARHFASAFTRPVCGAAIRRFELVENTRLEMKRPLILDAGCGNGFSTRQLAEKYADHLVIGVDKSKHRLGRGGAHQGLDLEGNCLLLRMNLQDFWILAAEHGWKLDQHYLLYANPWPKARHLARRWYAHPVFPTILKLKGSLEFRSNWHIYALEFRAALEWATNTRVNIEQFQASPCLSQFEIKYAKSGLKLYRGCINLDQVVT